MGVMMILLVLTLFLPVMFTMSDNATKSAIQGSDDVRSSYLARTMVEMAVAAYQDEYDIAEEELMNGIDHETATDSVGYKLNKFYTKKEMNTETLCMFRDTGIPTPEELKQEYETDSTDYTDGLKTYKKSGIVYVPLKKLGTNIDKNSLKYGDTRALTITNTDAQGSTSTRTGTFEFLGYADCHLTYDDKVEYYKTTMNADHTYNTKLIVDNPDTTENEGEKAYKEYMKNTSVDATEKVSKIEKRNIVFVATAKYNGKYKTRRCVVVLPTKPAKQNWIVPANLESNQIFVDSSKASSITTLAPPSGFFVDSDALQNQPVYVYSCIGNMVLSTDNLNIKTGTDANGNPTYKSYKDALAESVANNTSIPNINDYSLGVHPETTTVKPEKDPNFSCLKTNNMRSWAKSAQRDNFVAFTATNGIEVDMPINLIMNPCRTGRIGDGISNNQSLYKIMYMQAPNIVFKKEVNTFISLYQKKSVISNLLGYNAFRMSSLQFAAPASTPHSYYNHTRKDTVSAGKVYFMDDAYVWLIPFTEDGSNYKTQTVYYKGKDIILYKFANAGDVYFFNNDVVTNGEKAGFSMTGYFMDVLYNKDDVRNNNLKWYQFWSQLQNWIYNGSMEAFRNTTYVEEDLKFIGNIGSGGAEAVPVIDDLYVVWDS